MQPFVIVTLTALSVIAIVAAVLWACSRAGVLRFGRPAAHVDREELSPAESVQPWAGEDPSGPRTLHRCKNGHIYDPERSSQCPFCPLPAPTSDGSRDLAAGASIRSRPTIAYWPRSGDGTKEMSCSAVTVYFATDRKGCGYRRSSRLRA
jgi:hypothetical protein